MNYKSKAAIILFSLLTLTACGGDSNDNKTVDTTPTIPTTPKTPTTPSKNLLVNGGFETWADGKPTGWAEKIDTGITVEQSTDTRKTGLSSVAVSINTDNRKLADFRKSASVDVFSGKTYSFSAWIYHTGGKVKTRLFAGDYQEAYSKADDVNLWQEVKATYTAEADQSIELGFRFYPDDGFTGSEIVYVDNLSFTETATTEPAKPTVPTVPTEPIKPIDLGTYYDSAKGKTGFELKTALYNIIKGHTTKSYGDLWTFMAANSLDKYDEYDNDGYILDMYSENPSAPDSYHFTPGVDQNRGSSGPEGTNYNREHSFPKSWFGGEVSPMYTDIHHLYPTDTAVNSMRSNFPFGEVGTATTQSINGSKVGSARTGLGYTGTVFEPIDEFKGGFARSHFYMATRYENVTESWEKNSDNSNAVLNGSGDKVFEPWVIKMLKTWHANDGVSQKEIDRNAAAAVFQGNRNPFVDHPEYINEIWVD